MSVNGNLFDVRGKTAIVTGASSGLGVSFSEALAAAGAQVVLTARRSDRLDDVMQRIESTGGTAIAVPCDVADPAQVSSMVERTIEEFGSVEILVNNAGQTDGGPSPENLPDELFDQIVRVNLNGVWYCCKYAGRHMLRRGKGGSIINIASVLGMGGQQDYPPGYQATKAAVINLTKNLACSWANRGVRVNCIAPGWFPSEMTGPWLGNPEFLGFVESQAPMGRVGDPSELLGALLFFASDASSFVTGQTLAVDGGFTASLGGAPLPQSVVQFIEKAVPDGLGRRIMPHPDETN